MRRALAILAVLTGLGACSSPTPEPYGRLTENARAWVQAERAKDRDICAASHRTDTTLYRNCLDERSEARRDHLRALQDWYRQRRLSPGRSDCVDPLSGEAAVCYEI